MTVDFFIVGAPKAGTTSLYHYLNEHPEVCMSSVKEPDFFSDSDIYNQGLYYRTDRINTIEKYESLFQGKEETQKLGEASVSYLFYDAVPKKIKEYNVKGKIIIMLRNPTERAFSHYLMDYRLGLLSTPLEKIIEVNSNLKKLKLHYQQYIELGLYYKQIKRYFDVFEKENIHIIFYDELKIDAETIVKNVYKFIGVDSNFSATVGKKHNTYSMPKHNLIRKIYSLVWFRNLLNVIMPKRIIKKIKSNLFKRDKKPELDLVLRNKMIELFVQDITFLETLLSKDLSRWKK